MVDGLSRSFGFESGRSDGRASWAICIDSITSQLCPPAFSLPCVCLDGACLRVATQVVHASYAHLIPPTTDTGTRLYASLLTRLLRCILFLSAVWLVMFMK